ncbi:MAG: hypothetical protein KUG72_12905 [Pseudomonadales bacterium]|nr:hypothetical protein [Pseudomonadales bacterium]
MNKNNFYKGSMVLLCSALITACGSSSSGGGSGGSTTTTHSGVAADGYLINATVCLDLNNNKACDSDDGPHATTDENGAFSLEATQSQIDSNPVILIATAGETLDLDTGVAVTKDFVLTAPAGSEFVSPLTTLVQAKIEENRYVDGYSLENAVEAIQELLGTDAELLEDYVAKEESGDPDAADYQRLHEIAQVATQIIANNSEAAEGAAQEQNSESTPDELFRLVIAEVVDDIELIADAVDDDTAEEFDPATVLAVVEDDVEMDTSDIDDQVEQQQTEENTVIADIAALVSSTGGLNWFDLNLDEETGGFDGLETGTITYDAATGTTEDTDLIVESDGSLTVRLIGIQDLTLTPLGWVDDDEKVKVAVNADGSIDLNYQVLNGSITLIEHVTGTKVDVSNQAIAPFITSEDGPFDATAIVGSAVFSPGAEAYKLTFITKQDVYKLWNWSCGDNLVGGMCNAVWHNKGVGGYSEDDNATSMADVVVPVAVSTTAVSEDASQLNAISASWDLSVELVNDGTANFYEIDWSQGGSAIKRGTGTWAMRTVDNEDLYVVSPEASIRSSLNLDAGEHLLFAEYNGYVRIGSFEPAEVITSEDVWVFNDIAWHDVLGNYSEPGEAIALNCDYETPWDDVTEQPASFNSYTDFLAVVDDCGGRDTIVAADIADTTWVGSEVLGGVEESETIVFHANGTFDYSLTEDSVEVESGTGNWSVANNFVSIAFGGTATFVDTWAIINGTTKIYSEDSAWAPPADMVLDDGIDGEIWTGGYVNQAGSSNPTEFSYEWLAGKTLYDVWYTDGGAAVERMVFSADGTTVTIDGLLNSGEVDNTFSIVVTAEGAVHAVGESNAINIIVCGGTDDYFKAHHVEDGIFDNADLWFYEQDAALAYASSLTETIPPCGE